MNFWNEKKNLVHLSCLVPVSWHSVDIQLIFSSEQMYKYLFPPNFPGPGTGTKKGDFLILLDKAKHFSPMFFPSNSRITEALCSWPIRWPSDPLVSFLFFRAFQLPLQELQKWHKNVPLPVTLYSQVARSQRNEWGHELKPFYRKEKCNHK